MVWMEGLAATVKTVGALGNIAKSSPIVARQAKRTWWRIARGAVTLPVFGAGGVGKSTAAQVLAGQSPYDAYKPYTASWWAESVPLKGDIPGSIKVVPGQLARMDRHWPALFKTVVNGKALGLINVVAYGYHSLELPSFPEHHLWKEGQSIEEFADRYMEARRETEISLLDELLAGISAVTTPVWMITLVNKQDLWWDRRNVVRQHYENGLYSERLDRFRARLGSQAFQHEFLPVSLAIANLTTGSGEILASSVAGYGVDQQRKALETMSSQIRKMIEQ